MSKIRIAFDFVFGCHHAANLSRVFTIGGQSYRVCCACGAKFSYSLETMSIVNRKPNRRPLGKIQCLPLRGLAAYSKRGKYAKGRTA